MNTGGQWTAEDYPTEQFYHAITTRHVPYHVCGAQQDNSTLCTPFNWNVGAFTTANAPPPKPDSAAKTKGDSAKAKADTANAKSDSASSRPKPDITAGGMSVSYVVGGGEPGYIAPDPLDPDQFYSGTNNGGYLDKYNRRLGTSREVNPYPWFYSGEPSKDIKERWQWTYPIIFSPIDPKTLYVSSQRLWRTGRWAHLDRAERRPHPSRSGDDGKVRRPDHGRHEWP